MFRTGQFDQMPKGSGGYSWEFLLGVPPGYPNPDPTLSQKMSFFTPVFRHSLLEIMWSLLRLEQQQKRLLKIHFEFAYFSFFLTHFGIEAINKFVHSHSSLENHTRFQTKMSKVYTPFKTKTVHGEWKHYRLGRHLHLYGLFWGVPPPPTGADETEQFPLHTPHKRNRNTKKHSKFLKFCPSKSLDNFFCLNKNLYAINAQVTCIPKLPFYNWRPLKFCCLLKKSH